LHDALTSLGSTWETTQSVGNGIDLMRLVDEERIFVRVADFAFVSYAVGGNSHLEYENNYAELGEYVIAIFAIEA
jgi:hypothetical protein